MLINNLIQCDRVSSSQYHEQMSTGHETLDNELRDLMAYLEYLIYPR